MNNWGLVNLLHYFEDKCCTVRRDMVYSLISLSREAEKLKVNYQSPTSEVMREVLSICKDSVCVCTAAVLVRALGLESFVDAEPRLGNSALSVDMPILGTAFEPTGPVTRCPFCQSPLQFAGRSGSEVVLCLSTACKDAEGHMYKEPSCDSSDYILTLESLGERTLNTVGRIGEDIKISQIDNSNLHLLQLSLPPLLNIVGVPQWGRTLRQRSCGNLWPEKDRPDLERLSISTA